MNRKITSPGAYRAPEVVEGVHDRGTNASSTTPPRCVSCTVALGALGSVASILTRSTTAEVPLPEIVAQCFVVAGISRGAFILDERAGLPAEFASTGFTEEQKGEVRQGLHPAGGFRQSIDSGNGVRHLSLAHASKLELDFLNALDCSAALIAPVRLGGETPGALMLVATNLDLGHEEWVAFARALAVHVTETIALSRSISHLGESERRYRGVFEKARESIVIVDDHGAFFQVNPEAETLFGRSRKEILGHHFSEFVSSAGLPGVESAFQRGFEEQFVNAFGTEIQRPSGEIRIVDWSATSFPEAGRPTLLAIGTDVTARLEAKKALLKSEEQVRLLLSSTAEGIISMDLEGRCTFINPAGLHLLGIKDPAALIGHALHPLIHHSWPDGSPLALQDCNLIQTLRTGTGRSCDSEYLWRFDGTGFPAEYWAYPLKQGDRIVGAAVTFIDTTRRLQALSSLKESEQRFSQILQASRAVFYLTNLDMSKLFYVSPSYEAIWQRTTESLYQDPKSWMNAVHPEDKERMNESRLKTPGDVTTQYRIVQLDGKVRWILDQSFAVRNQRGETYRIAGSAEDITDQKAVEEQLRQAQKMEAVGLLAGGVAHDFNNLLTVIGGHAEFILEETEITQRTLEDGRAIQRASERAAGLTRQLLAFSRKQVLQQKVVILNSIITDIKKMLNRLIGEHIEIATRLAPDLGPVLVDPGQLEQVLMNLVVNARDAMPTGGKITIETANALPDAATRALFPKLQPGAHVRLSVSDTGLGMDASTQARVFEPFFTTKESGKGTGLGLSTVYGIVERSGGCVRISSRLGKGTCFDILLPRTKDDSASLLDSSTAMTPETPKLKILVVEDSDDVRLFTRRALENAGHNVVEAADPEIAMKLTIEGQQHFDLVITDIVMPKMSGLVMAERLTASQPGLKILFMSGYTDATLLPHGVLPANMPFLDKPFTTVALYAKIAETLGHSSP